jgi:hypothetical protein
MITSNIMVFSDAKFDHRARDLCLSHHMKNKLFNLTMWWSVIGYAVWVGGTVFMFSVINPQWSQDPPDSVRQFFLHTQFNRFIGHFFGPPFMAFRSFVPQLLALILGWHMKSHRPWILAVLGCTVLIIALTLFYIYPINNVLMLHGGSNQDALTIQRLTMQWLLADRIRFAIGLMGFILLLKAFRLPL